jgi:hypothetical protein
VVISGGLVEDNNECSSLTEELLLPLDDGDEVEAPVTQNAPRHPAPWSIKQIKQRNTQCAPSGRHGHCRKKKEKQHKKGKATQKRAYSR